MGQSAFAREWQISCFADGVYRSNGAWITCDSTTSPRTKLSESGLRPISTCTAMATAFAEDTSVIVCGFADGWLGSWHLHASTNPQIVGVGGSYNGDVQSVAVDAELHPATFSIGCTDGIVSDWELDHSATKCLALKHSRQAHAAPHVASTPHAGVSSVSLGPSAQLATGGSDGAVCLWQDRKVDNGGAACSTRRVIGTHEGAATALALAESYAISGGEDGAVRLWSPNADAELPPHDRDRRDVQAAAVRCLALDQAHSALSSASEDGFVRLWDVSVGRATRRLGHVPSAQARFSDRGVPAVAFDTQGRSTAIVSGAADGSLRVWDLRQPNPVDQVHAHADSVSSISLRGSRLLSGSCGGASAILGDMRKFRACVERVELQSPSGSIHTDEIISASRFSDEVQTQYSDDRVCSESMFNS